jgi:hypothetical protein
MPQAILSAPTHGQPNNWLAEQCLSAHRCLLDVLNEEARAPIHDPVPGAAHIAVRNDRGTLTLS